MKAGIYYNKNNLNNNGVYPETLRRMFAARAVDCAFVNEPSDLDGVEVLFVLGGDGTILNVAAECAKREIKIIGINYGHLGFLTQFEPDKMQSAVELVCGNKYAVEKRTMLEVECDGNTYLALNDAVIQRSTSGHDFSNTVQLRAVIDGSTVDNYLSDGIIISTPTGSTAYSLSAGGSVLTPDINAFIMTPICAHSLHSRPVVFNDNSVLEIIPSVGRIPINIVIDGKIVGVIGNSVIKVKKSEHCVSFISRSDKDFFKKLLIKLNIWSK